jgi:Replication-relaxation
MKPKRAPQAPLILTAREEDIVRAVYAYRFVTAQDITHLLLSRGSLTYARRLLSALCGGRDYQERQYLFRFPLPTPSPGSREKVYTLGALGRECVKHAGFPVDWYYRPGKAGRLSRSSLLHHLVLTRFVCAAHAWGRPQPGHGYALGEARLCYELSRNPLRTATHAGGERATGLAAIPDAWLLFERLSDGAYFPILVEIDRGSEYQERFKAHVRARIEFIRSGDYARVFDTPAVIIAYVTTGHAPPYAETRRKTMATWTMEVLAELELNDWAGVFRFTAVTYDTLYEDVHAIFEEPVWYRPDSPTPVPLFAP